MAFKKLKDFFFEEVEDDEEEFEEEIEEEEESEDFELSRETKKGAFSFFERHGKEKDEEEKIENTRVYESIKSAMSDITLEDKEDKRPREEFIPKEDVTPIKFYDVASKPSTFIDLEEPKVESKMEQVELPVQEANVIQQPQPQVGQQTQATHQNVAPNPMRREMPSKSVEIKDYRNGNTYEYRTVISPIYGRTGKDAEIFETHDSQETSKNQGANGSYLGTVFSPMYGQKRVEEKTKKEEPKQAVNVNVVEELPPLRDIDELIESPKRNKDGDVHQYSLFDDISKNNQKVEEKVSENDISEFFE